VSTPPTPAALSGPALTSRLIEIWICGFTSGAATVAMNCCDLPPTAADQFADYLAERGRRDPVVMAAVEQEVLEVLAGVPGKPRTVTCHGTPPRNTPPTA